MTTTTTANETTTTNDTTRNNSFNYDQLSAELDEGMVACLRALEVDASMAFPELSMFYIACLAIILLDEGACIENAERGYTLHDLDADKYRSRGDLHLDAHRTPDRSIRRILEVIEDMLEGTSGISTLDGEDVGRGDDEDVARYIDMGGVYRATVIYDIESDCLELSTVADWIRDNGYEAAPQPCPVCDGDGKRLGRLGDLVHWRCEDCGAQWEEDVDPEDDSDDDYDGPTCGYCGDRPPSGTHTSSRHGAMCEECVEDLVERQDMFTHDQVVYNFLTGGGGIEYMTQLFEDDEIAYDMSFCDETDNLCKEGYITQENYNEWEIPHPSEARRIEQKWEREANMSIFGRSSRR